MSDLPSQDLRLETGPGTSVQYTFGRREVASAALFSRQRQVMASNSIFREAALERLSTPERLDQGLTVVGSMSWALLGGLSALVVGGLIWSVVVVVPVTVKGEGILLSPGGVLDVTSDSPGRVTQFLVRTDDTVAVGQIVAR